MTKYSHTECADGVVYEDHLRREGVRPKYQQICTYDPSLTQTKPHWLNK